MGGGDDCHSRSLQRFDDADECFPIGMIESVEGFVEEDERRAGNDDAGEEDSLSLPAGKLPEAAGGTLRKINGA